MTAAMSAEQPPWRRRRVGEAGWSQMAAILGMQPRRRWRDM